MINLEWLRSFRTVYTTLSVSKASELLNISQPTVSQHIAALETYLDKRLFERKSKGVLPTSDGRQLNNLIAGPIEALEVAELSLTKKESPLHAIISIGISKHLYKSIISDKFHQLGDRIHLHFGDRETLIKEVERGNLLYAIIPEDITSFDLICHKLFEQNMVLVSSPDIDLDEYSKIYRKNKEKAEQWLYQYKWYAHDTNCNFIKGYWLHLFNKKRPTLIADYVVPNEHEILYQLSVGSGLSVALNTSASPFITSGKLKSSCVNKLHIRDVSLICNKKKTDSETTTRLIDILRSEHV